MWWRKQVRFDVAEDGASAYFYVNNSHSPKIYSKQQAREWVVEGQRQDMISERRAEQLRRMIDATELPEMSDVEIEEAKPARFQVQTLDDTPMAAIPHGLLIGSRAKRLGVAFSKAVAHQRLAEALKSSDLTEEDRVRIAAEIDATTLPVEATDVDVFLEIANKIRADREPEVDRLIIRIHGLAAL